MSYVIPEEVFAKRKYQKEFDTLYEEFVQVEPEILSNGTLKEIFEKYKPKVVAHYAVDKHIEKQRLNGNDVFKYIGHYEWDYFFISENVLRLSITSSYWYDLYFTVPMTREEADDYCLLLEDDVRANAELCDNHFLREKILSERLIELQDEYFYKFNEELLPTRLI